MKRLTLSTLAIATALFAAQASAGDRYDRYDDRYDRQARYDDRYDSRHDGRYDRGNAYGRWDTARVVRVERIGNVFTGYWYEAQGRTAVQRECDPARGGERIFGRFTLTFSADRKSFTGLHSTCDEAPEDAYFASWNGTLTGEVPAAAATHLVHSRRSRS